MQPELQLRNILCPVDFSDFSQSALLYATGLGRRFGARVFVQHTVQPSTVYMGGLDASPAIIDTEVQIRSAREEVRKMLAAAKIDFSAVTLLLNSGNLTSRILETSSKERIDLLVMGSHGHRGFTRLIMGSNTEGMIHASICPVLVVTQATSGFFDPELGKEFKSLLLATDFSRSSDRALAVALKWAHEFGARVTLLHCVEEIPETTKGITDIFPEYNPYFEKQLAWGWKQIEHLVPESERQGLEVVCEVRHGNPKEEIVRVASEKRADLIVTGARGTGKVAVPWGSVSSNVARNGSIPVLVVRSLAYFPKQ
jgi:nucleotide-binding universal stress UspA family protein